MINKRIGTSHDVRHVQTRRRSEIGLSNGIPGISKENTGIIKKNRGMNSMI